MTCSSRMPHRRGNDHPGSNPRQIFLLLRSPRLQSPPRGPVCEHEPLPTPGQRIRAVHQRQKQLSYTTFIKEVNSPISPEACGRNRYALQASHLHNFLGRCISAAQGFTFRQSLLSTKQWQAPQESNPGLSGLDPKRSARESQQNGGVPRNRTWHLWATNAYLNHQSNPNKLNCSRPEHNPISLRFDL